MPSNPGSPLARPTPIYCLPLSTCTLPPPQASLDGLVNDVVPALGLQVGCGQSGCLAGNWRKEESEVSAGWLCPSPESHCSPDSSRLSPALGPLQLPLGFMLSCLHPHLGQSCRRSIFLRLSSFACAFGLLLTATGTPWDGCLGGWGRTPVGDDPVPKIRRPP